MADEALRPLPSASTTLHRAGVLRTHIDNFLSIGEVQAPSRRTGCYSHGDQSRWLTYALRGCSSALLAG